MCPSSHFMQLISRLHQKRQHRLGGMQPVLRLIIHDTTGFLGYFVVYLVTDGGNTSTSLLQGDEYQASPAINQGYNTNHLKITCSGDQLIFEVNGVTLFSGNDSSYTDGDIRFTTQIYESTPNEIHYDNFAATTP